jgi:hypothetical protein
MPHERTRWRTRVRDVELEYLAARVAIDWLLEAEPEEVHRVAENGGYPDPPREAIYIASNYLAATYLIRMFSVFERAVKSYWLTLPDTADRRPTAEEIIDEVGVAVRFRITADEIVNAQDIRELRNKLVHGRLHEFAPVVDVVDMTIRLLRYLDHLPPDWG